MVGGPKTATTAICGVLNSHPDVFMMCEVFLNQSYPSRHGSKLLRHSPEMQPFFLREFAADRLNNYRRAQAWLSERGFARRYFGDKFADIDSGFSEMVGNTKTIFCVRFLPEWVANGSVRTWYPLDNNVVPCAVQYTKHFLESFLLQHVAYVRMEDFLGANDRLVDRLWAFLEVDAPETGSRWWESVGHYAPEDPKSALNWWKGHMSSAVAPQSNDTKIKIRETAFWSDILPLFRKYYDAAGEGASIPAKSVRADIRYLEALIGKHRFSIEESYVALQTGSRGKEMKAKRQRNQRLKKMLNFLALGK